MQKMSVGSIPIDPANLATFDMEVKMNQAIHTHVGIYNCLDWLMPANHPDVPWKPIHPSALMFGIVAGSYNRHPIDDFELP